MALHFPAPHTAPQGFDAQASEARNPKSSDVEGIYAMSCTESQARYSIVEDSMRKNGTLVCGTYSNEATLEYALCHLRNVGFLDANFTVLFPEDSFNNISKVITLNGGILSFQAIRSGGILLWIQCESAGQALVAKKILECTEADAVSSSSEAQVAPQADQSTSFRNLA